jgi:NADP-dependent 3-hydroxy acid dehydrogenase YdfG
MAHEQKGSVLVTGASSGIGLAITRQLLECGFTVFGIARDFSKADISHAGFHGAELDLASADAIQTGLPPLLKSLDEPLRAVVNNAGIGKMGYLEQLSVADIQSVLAVNLLSHILISRLCLPVMKQQSVLSDLIFVGSEAALTGGKEGSVYCASKFGLRGFAQSLRLECAKSEVRVSLINPGAVRTAFFDDLHFEPGDREENAIHPEDVAAMVLSILSMRGGTVVDEINLSPHKRVWQSK